jgi:hypothetical protein
VNGLPISITRRVADSPCQMYARSHFLTLKVPKRENFSLAFFALSEPIWVGDLGTGEKNRIFYQLTPDFDGFWFFAAYECAVNKKKF